MLSLCSPWFPRRCTSAQLWGFLCAGHQHPALQGRAGHSPSLKAHDSPGNLIQAPTRQARGTWAGARHLNCKVRPKGSVLDMRESKGWGYRSALGTPNLYSTIFCETTEIEADDLSWGSTTHVKQLITRLMNRYFTGLISCTPATADHPHPSQILWAQIKKMPKCQKSYTTWSKDPEHTSIKYQTTFSGFSFSFTLDTSRLERRKSHLIASARRLRRVLQIKCKGKKKRVPHL